MPQFYDEIVIVAGHNGWPPPHIWPCREKESGFGRPARFHPLPHAAQRRKVIGLQV